MVLDLESAIEHYKEVADEEKKKSEENFQLAEWLKELKNARETLHAMYGRIGYL